LLDSRIVYRIILSCCSLIATTS